MKALLGLIGLGASLFAVLHVFALVGDISSGAGAGLYGPTRLLGHVVGIAIGLLIAIVCFRKCAGGANAPASDDRD
jgi:hypothetical protein